MWVEYFISNAQHTMSQSNRNTFGKSDGFYFYLIHVGMILYILGLNFLRFCFWVSSLKDLRPIGSMLHVHDYKLIILLMWTCSIVPTWIGKGP